MNRKGIAATYLQKMKGCSTYPRHQSSWHEVAVTAAGSFLGLGLIAFLAEK